MTEHTSPQFRAILRENGWTDESIDTADSLAIAREVKELRKEGITESAAASESGSVVGATGGADDAAGLQAELERLQALPKTAENFAARKKVREALNQADPIKVVFG